MKFAISNSLATNLFDYTLHLAISLEACRNVLLDLKSSEIE